MKIYELTTATNLDRAMLIPISLLKQDMKISLGQIIRAVEDGIVLPPSLKAEYSADGSTWHTGMKSSDEWVRVSDDGGATWGDPMPLRGKDGQEGLRNYTWIKFADDEHGAGMSDSPVGKSWLGIAYNRDTADESDDPADYKWMSVRGEDGRSVKNKVMHFGLSPSASIAPLTYTAVPPGKVPLVTAINPYLWSYETTYYSDGTMENTEPAILTVRGDKGDSPTIKWDGTKLRINGLEAVELRGEAGHSPVVGFDEATERLLVDGKPVSGSLRGQQGDSAYDSWRKLTGSNHTLQEWLDSLNGKDGEKGEKGNPGANGVDGKTPEIDPLTKRWKIGDKLTDVLAQGVDGKTWKPRVGTDGTLSWVRSDDSTLPDSVNIKGEKGERGEQGLQGIRGLQGEKGDKGDQGIQGERGLQGLQGLSAYEVFKKNNSSSSLTESQWVASLKGEKGERGEQGLQGIRGLQGEKGDKGDQGIQGERGLQGIQGLSAYEVFKKNNSSSSLTESQWVASLKGEKGNPGADGVDGKTFRPAYDPVTKKITFSASTDTSAVVMEQVASVDMVEKLQVVSDKDGRFQVVTADKATATGGVVKVTDFTAAGEVKFVDGVISVGGQSITPLTHQSIYPLTIVGGAFSIKSVYNPAKGAGTLAVPTHTSHLTNDSGFLTSHQSLANYVTLNTAQTITGRKSIYSASLKLLGSTAASAAHRHSAGALVFQENNYDDQFGIWGNFAGTGANQKLYIGGSGTGASLDNNANGTTFTPYLTIEHTTGNLTVLGRIIKSGGTSAQFLKADGSVDSHDYATNSDVADLLGNYVTESALDRYLTKENAELTFVTGLAVSGNQIAPVIYGVTGKAITVPYATNANGLASNPDMTYGVGRFQWFNINATAGCTAKVNDAPTSAWWHILRLNHANNAGYYTDIAVPFNQDSLYWKCVRNGSLAHTSWIRILDTLNYASILDSRYYTEAEADAKYVTTLGIAGDWLTWTKNGAVNNITVQYATESKVLRSHGRLTAVSGAKHGSGVRLYEVYNNGYPTTYGNVLAVQGSSALGAGELLMGWSGSDAGHTSLYYRNCRDNTTTWSAWATILDSVNYSTILDGRYVKKSGDTMTGALAIQSVLTVNSSSTYRLAMGGGDSYCWIDCRDSSNTMKNNLILYPDRTVAGKYLAAPYYTASTTTLCSNLNADLWDGEHRSSFFMRKRYSINLASLSSSNFYPVTFGGNNREQLDCEIMSPSATGSAAYNQNHIHFLLTANGWSDTAQRFVMLTGGNYDDNEITIGAVGAGARHGERCVWLRGGLNYTVIANHAPTLRTTDYTYGDEKYTVGTGLSGGTNAHVNICWQNNSSRNNQGVALIGSNVASATKWQTARRFWGQLADGTGDVSGNMTGVGTIYCQGTAGSYREGIRIKPYSNWSTIVLGGNDLTADEGTSANSWSIHNNNGNFYINKNNASAQGAPRLWGHANGWTVGNTSRSTYALNAASFICESWVRTVGATGWYSETYGGGWYMSDTTWLRIHGNKSLYASGGIIRTDGELQIGDNGSKFRVTAAGVVSAASSVTAASLVKRGGTSSQVLMADGSVKEIWRRGYSAEAGVAIPMGSDKQGSYGEIIDAFDLQLWNGAYIVDATARIVDGSGTEIKSRLAYCKHGEFGTMATKNASDYVPSMVLTSTLNLFLSKADAEKTYQPKGNYLTSHQSLANYMTLNTAQTITGNKTFTGLVTAKAIQPESSGTYNLGTMGLHWNHVFCRRLYVTSGGSDSLTAANLGAALGTGWLELRSSGTPYIDLTGGNSTADYNVRLAYQNSQLEVLGSHLSVANTLRCKAYVAMIFDAIGSDTKANTYGMMVYKRGTYFNFVKTVKGAPDTISSSHGGSLMEINLATNATTFSGSVTQNSDARLKDILGDTGLSFRDVAALPSVRFRWKASQERVNAGTVAQSVNRVLPEVVYTDGDGYLAVDYGALAHCEAVTVARGLVGVADEVELLKARVGALEKENEKLRKLLAA